MLRAFEDFRTDLLKAVQGQLFKDHFCPPYYINPNNTGIKTIIMKIQLAYGDGTGYGHLTNYFGALNKQSFLFQIKNIKIYAEIKPIDSSLGGDLLGGFTNNKFFLLKPPVCDNDTRAQVFRTIDFTAPELVGMTILIEDQNGLPAPQVVAMEPVIE